MKEHFEIVHYIYGNVCSDSWYGKTSSTETDVVYDTEENVSAFVERLNKEKHSVFPHPEIWEDEEDAYDCDYYYYNKITINGVDKLEGKYFPKPISIEHDTNFEKLQVLMEDVEGNWSEIERILNKEEK